MKLSGADIFVQVLLEQGVDTLFGYPGGAVLNLYDALYKASDKITHIMTAHEQGASHAADGVPWFSAWYVAICPHANGSHPHTAHGMPW